MSLLELPFVGVTATTIKVKTHPHVLTPSTYALTFGKLLWARELRGCRMLDVGCGSGILSIIAATQGAEVWATDISSEALELTEENSKRNGVSLERILESDVLDTFLEGGRHFGEQFDLIVCNNPSLPGKNSKDLDRHSCAEWNENGNGRYILDSILEHGKKILTETGSLLTHTSSEQKWRKTSKLLSQNWEDWQTLLVLEMPIDSEYYDKVREEWLADGSAYTKRGRILHIVNVFEAFAKARTIKEDEVERLLSVRLLRETLNI